MRNSDQPQNIKKLGRDAAVQISEEAKPDTDFDKFWAKRQAILNGSVKQQKQWSPDDYRYAAGELATIVALLTSSKKYSREDGKTRMRELVKLGTEVGK